MRGGGGTEQAVTEAQSSNETQTEQESDSSASAEETTAEEEKALCEDVIDNEAFHMTFENMDFHKGEYSFDVGNGARYAPNIDNGYRLLVLEGHIENKATYMIPAGAFSCSINVNDSFEVDDAKLNFCRSDMYELDPYTDFDYVIYAAVPAKLAEEFDSATVTIGFNNDMSKSAGSEETENLYTLTSDLTTAALTDERSSDGTEGSSGQTEEAALMNLWYEDFYVDDFNQPTDQWLVTTQKFFPGTFNNSIATNANLAVKIVVDFDKDITIFLHSYNDRNPDKNIGVDKNFNITMRTADGTDHSLTGIFYAGDDRLYVDDAYIDEVLTALLGEGNISFYLENSSDPIENYLFTIMPDNFKTIYEEATK